MSSILKALKKLEQEKATRRSREPNITGAMLKTPVSHHKNRPWLIPLGMVLVAVLAVLTTYSLMGGFSRKSSQQIEPNGSISRQLPQTTSVPQQIPIEKVQSQPVAPLPKLSPADAIESIKPSIRAKGPALVTAPAPKPNSPSQRVRIPIPMPATPTPTEQNDAPSKHSSQSTLELPAEPHRPVLKVSGIAWQKDNASRLAMVNGTSVVEGSMVEGVKVEEILPDKVRFSFEKKTFEIGVGKSSESK